MRREYLDHLDREGLLEYIDSLLWQYRLVDAFWFLRVENRFDLTSAEELNAEVWGKVAQLAARDIKRRFGLEQDGIEGFARALRLFPWTLMVGYEPRFENGEMIVEVAHCPPHEGRKKHGLGEYACKDMHRNEFENFAREIDPRIEVVCDFAPPDPHPDELYCRWRFRLRREAGTDE